MSGEPVVTASVCDLDIVARCGCGADYCAGFYTAPKPDKSYGPKHRGICLEPKEGHIILDLVEDRIMFIEVLDSRTFGRRSMRFSLKVNSQAVAVGRRST